MNDRELAKFIGGKIKDFRLSNGYTQEELAKKIGMGKSTIANYEKGFRTPKKNTMFVLSDVFGISIDDFFPPINQKNTNSNMVAIQETVEKLEEPRRVVVLNTAKKQLEEQEKGFIEEPSISYLTERYPVKTVTQLAAGLGYGFDDSDINTVEVANEPPRHDLASIVNGDSMLPNYKNGDVVYLVDKGVSHYSGQVCAVVVNDKTYLKKVYSEPKGLRLVSINPAYDDILIDFPPSDGTHVKIFSVVGSDAVVR